MASELPSARVLAARKFACKKRVKLLADLGAAVAVAEASSRADLGRADGPAVGGLELTAVAAAFNALQVHELEISRAAGARCFSVD